MASEGHIGGVGVPGAEAAVPFRHHGLDLLRIAAALGLGWLCSVETLLGSKLPQAGALGNLIGGGERVLSAAVFVMAGVALGLRYRSATIDQSGFWRRRLLRLLPLFVMLLLFRTFGARGDFVFDRWLDALLSLGYFPKAFADRPGSFAHTSWLLGPLLQLYLVFPFIHRFSQSLGLRWVGGVVAVAVLGRFLAFGVGADAQDLWLHTTIGRLDQFVLGYVTGQLFLRRQHVAVAIVSGLGLGGMGLAAEHWLAPFPNLSVEYRELSPLCLGLVVAATLLLLLEATKPLRASGVSGLLPLIYGAHLFLLPVLDGLVHHGRCRFTLSTTANAALNAAFVAMPLAFCVGWLLKVTFEEPFLAAVQRWRASPEASEATAPLESKPDLAAARFGMTAGVRSQNIKYVAALDHLRGVAALLVIAYHSHQGRGGVVAAGECRGLLWSFLLEGHSGVGLFMMLSGFVFMHGAQGSVIDYWRFIYNRVLRVYPLLVVLLIVAASAYRGVFSVFSVLQSFLTLGNLAGAATYQNNISGIAWTLAPEFQFYLLFPLLFRKLEERRSWYWLSCFFLSLVAFRVLVFCIGNDLYDMIYWTVFGRLSQFMIGMLAARAYRRWGSHGLLFPLAVGLLLALHSYEHHHGSILAPGGPLWTGSIDAVQGVVWALVLVSYIPIAERLPQLLARPLRWLGTISYSLYLLHYGFLVTLQQRQWFPQLAADRHLNAVLVFVAFELPLLLLACSLTYNVIEKPFLALRVRYLEPAPSTGLG
jgi:peptidoglycan/LPS O-acetylase OafA/YrhL